MRTASLEPELDLWLKLLKEHREHPGSFCLRWGEGIASNVHSQRLAVETVGTQHRGQQRPPGSADAIRAVRGSDHTGD